MIKSALLVLEDGTQFYGQSIGADGIAVGEVVFNTSITGYQEILTDPSYYNQIVTLTYPHIGNTGINEADNESSRVQARALVIRNLPLIDSNFRKTMSLSEYLKQQNIVSIADIDTRKLTRYLRDNGTKHGCVIAGKHLDAQLALHKAREFPGLKGIDLVKEVSTNEQFSWNQGSWTLEGGLPDPSNNLPYHVVAYDYGIKRNIMRMLVDRGCRLTVVPAHTSPKTVLMMNPDGIFLSNGPGDPAPCEYAVNAIKTFLTTEIPIFGICLGHQLLSLASGANTVKMHFGHHGSNHPVKDLDTGRVMITAQNHGFVVDEKTLPAMLRITHVSLFDGTLQGLHHTDRPAFSFQGHPEASPGPQDASLLFNHFMDLMSYYCLQPKYLRSAPYIDHCSSVM